MNPYIILGVLRPIRKPTKQTEPIRKTPNRKKTETEKEKTEPKPKSLVRVWGRPIQNRTKPNYVYNCK